MPIQYINGLLGLPELQIQQIISIDAKEVHLEATPMAYKQLCPLCHSEANVKGDDRNETRQIRYQSIFEKKSYVHIPSIRIICTACRIRFIWSYACSVWEWKEPFSQWYDYSPNINVASLGFNPWFEQDENIIDHPAVQSTLKTMRNWQEEIVNYHHCRFMNATVEGRHKRIKAYQRRCCATLHVIWCATKQVF